VTCLPLKPSPRSICPAAPYPTGVHIPGIPPPAKFATEPKSSSKLNMPTRFIPELLGRQICHFRSLHHSRSAEPRTEGTPPRAFFSAVFKGRKPCPHRQAFGVQKHHLDIWTFVTQPRSHRRLRCPWRLRVAAGRRRLVSPIRRAAPAMR
jgi:hypothetical protein